jgi:radical SAM superfamily enzyme YgiQ (UPF0313 family)
MSGGRKVRFIEPQGRRGRPFNAWVGRWPLLGPIILASILKQKGYDVAVYNENILGRVLENPAYLSDLADCDVVCLTIMTPTACRGYQIAGRLRQVNPKAVIAIGGVHASFMPQEAIQYADIVCRGEGEGVIEAIARGDITRGIVEPGPVEDLDSVARPDFGVMVGFDRLVNRLGRRRYELPMMTSRGCPYGCTYCSVSRMFGRKVRRQSLDRIFGDVEHYSSQGFRHLMFYDDNFAADRQFTRLLLERVAPLRLKFNAQVRADFVWKNQARDDLDQPLLEAMRQGGADVLYVGFETIDDRTARQWHKGYSDGGSLRDQLREDTQIFHDNGFWVHGMFVLGPQHEHRDARGIVDFARETRMESLQVSILTPLPGTPVYAQMRPHLVLDDYPADWDYYDGAHCVYDHGRLGLEELTKTLIRLHARFYGGWGMSLRRLLTTLRKDSSLRENLRTLYLQAKTSRRILKLWQQETRSFIELVRRRLADRVPQLGA